MSDTTGDSRPKGSPGGDLAPGRAPSPASSSRNGGSANGSPSRGRAIGLALKLAREQCGLSQGEVATAIGVSQATVSAWEIGSRAITADRLLQLTELYEQDLGEFGRTLRIAEDRPGTPSPEVAGPLPTPEELARRLLGLPPGGLPVNGAEPALTGMLEHIYALAEALRRHQT